MWTFEHLRWKSNMDTLFMWDFEHKRPQGTCRRLELHRKRNKIQNPLPAIKVIMWAGNKWKWFYAAGDSLANTAPPHPTPSHPAPPHSAPPCQAPATVWWAVHANTQTRISMCTCAARWCTITVRQCPVPDLPKWIQRMLKSTCNLMWQHIYIIYVKASTSIRMLTSLASCARAHRWQGAHLRVQSGWHSSWCHVSHCL